MPDSARPRRNARLGLIGIVYDQPDEQAAIKQAIEELQVPAKSTRPADRAATGLSHPHGALKSNLVF
jgi:hypothetical protein